MTITTTTLKQIEQHEVMMLKNIIKTLFEGMCQKIDMSVILDLKMKKLMEPFNLPTTYNDCNVLLKTLCCRQYDLIKCHHANQATNYVAGCGV